MLGIVLLAFTSKLGIYGDSAQTSARLLHTSLDLIAMAGCGSASAVNSLEEQSLKLKSQQQTIGLAA